MPSAFTSHGTCTKANSLALLQLRRDLITPVQLSSDANAVLNTRFGTYPHSTLLGVPWGAQIRASRVSGLSGKRVKRQRTNGGQQTTHSDEEQDVDELVILGSADAGFAHVLPPTPELWTQSLPHRTQVVYTPDYSYILQRLRVRPGSVVIEAGAGSGSFTHAAARAVYNGAGDGEAPQVGEPGRLKPRHGPVGTGKVYSYEYHKPRAAQLVDEVHEHGLDDIVTVTHRDVYEDGFLIDTGTSLNMGDAALTSQPQATAVFLDLPAPWLALKHLTRMPEDTSNAETSTSHSDLPLSPLSPHHTIYLCTFSPCIEQVQQTISELVRLGWSSIETVTLAHHDIMARRERVGVAEEGSRDGNPMPASVDEAVAHLRATRQNEEEARQRMIDREAKGERKRGSGKVQTGKTGKEKRVESLLQERKGRSLWREGRLVTRTEGELKGHTSFLTFALLPRVWTEEDDARAAREVESAFRQAAGRSGKKNKEASQPNNK